MMNNTKSVKNTNDSPKTPGGISKSYLTPIRRVGLSRNFRKSGRSPFISPLSAHNSETETNKPDTECRKRKKISNDEDNERDIEFSLSNESITASPISCNSSIISDINGTPSRNLLVKKKSKTLILTNDCTEEAKSICEDLSGSSNNTENNCESIKITENSPNILSNKVVKLSRNNSKNKTFISKDSLIKVEQKELTKHEMCKNKEQTPDTTNAINENKSPNNLTKECVVVIQKKLLNSIDIDKNKKAVTSKNKGTDINPVSQILFDSDCEDIPLSNINTHKNVNINKKASIINNKTIIPIQDDDFQENKIEIKKLVDKSTSVSELKALEKEKKASKTKAMKPPIKIENTPSSQSSNSYDDDDDDFKFDKKKTIILRKCYSKITKPSKAKSTGSITQQDIDEMKERIETKKKLLLAKSLTNDTLELRDLIKKWQRGCQNALTELLELMKKKMPDKQNMNYSEILQILKIPPNLVGYDSENDCFLTPDDATIVLSSLNA